MADPSSQPLPPNRESNGREPKDPESVGREHNTYLKTCSQCEQLVRMVKADDGTWKSVEPGGEPPLSAPEHDCDSVPAISTDWSLRALDHELTCRLDCWWCSEEVYLHTRGNGTFALFDDLSWPWPAHSCWHERKKEQDRALLKLESDLRARGYQGQGSLIGMASSAAPDSIPAKARKNPPVLQILLSATDHQAVDAAVEQITRFVSNRHHRDPMPIPLPVGKKVEASGGTGSPGDGKTAERVGSGKHAGQDQIGGERFVEHVHHRAVEMWDVGPELIAQLRQVQLSEAVSITIRQAMDT